MSDAIDITAETNAVVEICEAGNVTTPCCARRPDSKRSRSEPRVIAARSRRVADSSQAAVTASSSPAPSSIETASRLYASTDGRGASIVMIS